MRTKYIGIVDENGKCVLSCSPSSVGNGASISFHGTKGNSVVLSSYHGVAVIHLGRYNHDFQVMVGVTKEEGFVTFTGKDNKRLFRISWDSSCRMEITKEKGFQITMNPNK